MVLRMFESGIRSSGDRTDSVATATAADAAEGESPRRWTRLADRGELIKHATSDDEAWRRVGVVCGAGLGKTTNLKWLEAAINGLDDGRGKQLAIFLVTAIFIIGTPNIAH